MFGYLDVCKEIIDAYETNVPYFLFDGNYSEHLTKEMVQDIWVLYDDGLRFEDMEALMFSGRITEKVNDYGVQFKKMLPTQDENAPRGADSSISESIPKRSDTQLGIRSFYYIAYPLNIAETMLQCIYLLKNSFLRR